MDTYHRWMETVMPWSLTQLPNMGMPAGFNSAGLPVGIQLIGRDNDEMLASYSACLALATEFDSRLDLFTLARMRWARTSN